MKKTLLTVCILSLLAVWTTHGIRGLLFSLRCEQYLKRSADSNIVKLAKDNLDIAITYLEERELTNGVVGIFLKQPGNDIGFFYTNLKACQTELENIKEDATQLEKSNILMKLRETILDSSQNGVSVTHPCEMYVYPYQRMYFYLGCFFFIGACIMSFKVTFDF